MMKYYELEQLLDWIRGTSLQWKKIRRQAVRATFEAALQPYTETIAWP